MKGRPARLLLAILLVLATFPLSPTRALAAGCDSGGQQPTTTVYLPNVTKTLGGPAGWVTPFYVQNAGAIQTALDVSFFRFSDGSLVACRRTTGLAPGTSLVDNPNADADLPDDTQFSVVVKSFGAPVVAIVNQLRGSGATQQSLSYSGFTRGDTTVYLPNVTRRFFGYDVPFIIQDLGTATASVTARFMSFDGTQTYTRTLQVASGRSGVVDPDFEPASTPPGSGLSDGTQYAVTLTADQPIAVVVNAHNEQGSPVAFSHNGLAAGGTILYAPYAVKSASLFSPVVVQNLATTAVDAALTFVPLAGGAPQSFVLTALPAGGSRAFDPRFTLGTSTPCATAVAATCLGSGEYALRITAPTAVAAVVLPNSATTAAGYLASATPTQRALLPVVLRTIGGVSGWTTTTYLQSTTATQATVRWFSIDTGDLVTTQTLTLAAGATTKLDPRTVTGLADNAQYSVTVDGNGPLVAIGFEQAATGGDASMIYEASALQPLAAVPGQAASIKMTPATASLTTGATQAFTVTVRDAFGAAIPTPATTFSLAPQSLGTVAATAPGTLTFTAAAAGTGTLTVTAGQVSASATVTVAAPTTRTVGGITFNVRATGTSDVYTESTITTADAQTIAATVDGDVAKVQTEFARSFASRPSIYVFGTVQNATAGNQSIFKMTAAKAAQFAKIGGFFDTLSSTSVVVNWHVESEFRPITVTRHELTHMMIQQIAGKFTWIPAWIDEGNARLVDNTVPGAGWWADVNRYTAVSAAAQVPSRLLPLADLVDQEVWNARTAPTSSFQYSEASRAAQFVRDDVGVAGTIRILELLGQGPSGPSSYIATFNAAFQTVTGKSFASFAAAFPGRLKASIPSYPGLATTTETPGGPGLHFVAYGFSPSATVTYTLAGPSTATFTATTDEYGALRRYFTTAFNWLPGPYVVTVTESPTKSATATAPLAAATSAQTRTAEDLGPDAGSPFDREDPPRPPE